MRDHEPGRNRYAGLDQLAQPRRLAPRAGHAVRDAERGDRHRQRLVLLPAPARHQHPDGEALHDHEQQAEDQVKHQCRLQLEGEGGKGRAGQRAQRREFDGMARGPRFDLEIDEQAKQRRQDMERVGSAHIGDPEEAPAVGGGHVRDRRKHHDEAEDLDHQAHDIAARRQPVRPVERVDRGFQAARIIGEFFPDFPELAVGLPLHNLVPLAFHGERQEKETEHGGREEDRQDQVADAAVEPGQRDDDRPLHLAEQAVLVRRHPALDIGRLLGGRDVLAGHSVAAPEIVAEPAQPKTQDLRVEAAALVIAGRDDRPVRHLREGRIDLGRGHLPHRHVEGAGKMAAIEFLGIADVDEERVLLVDEAPHFRRVQKDVVVRKGRQAAHLGSGHARVPDDAASLGEPLLVAADDEAAIDPHLGEGFAQLGAAVARMTEQDVPLAARLQRRRLRQHVRIADMAELRELSGLPFLGFAHVDQVDRHAAGRLGALQAQDLRQLLRRDPERMVDLLAVVQGLERHVADALARFLRCAHQIGAQALHARVRRP